MSFWWLPGGGSKSPSAAPSTNSSRAPLVTPSSSDLHHHPAQPPPAVAYHTSTTVGGPNQPPEPETPSAKAMARRKGHHRRLSSKVKVICEDCGWGIVDPAIQPTGPRAPGRQYASKSYCARCQTKKKLYSKEEVSIIPPEFATDELRLAKEGLKEALVMRRPRYLVEMKRAEIARFQKQLHKWKGVQDPINIVGVWYQIENTLCTKITVKGEWGDNRESGRFVFRMINGDEGEVYVDELNQVKLLTHSTQEMDFGQIDPEEGQIVFEDKRGNYTKKWSRAIAENVIGSGRKMLPGRPALHIRAESCQAMDEIWGMDDSE